MNLKESTNQLIYIADSKLGKKGDNDYTAITESKTE